MIQYALTCKDGHKFDSWFKSVSAFDQLKCSNMVTCPICGGSQVEKSIMTPRVNQRSNIKPDAATPNFLSDTTPTEAAAAKLRRLVEENSHYVGGDFVNEARAIHDGTAPERSIYGEAAPEQARKLLEEGILVAPLPFIPARKSN